MTRSRWASFLFVFVALGALVLGPDAVAYGPYMGGTASTSNIATPVIVQGSSGTIAEIMPYPTIPSLGAMWLGQGFTPTGINYAIASDATGTTYLNGPGAIVFQIAGTSITSVSSSLFGFGAIGAGTNRNFVFPSGTLDAQKAAINCQTQLLKVTSGLATSLPLSIPIVTGHMVHVTLDNSCIQTGTPANASGSTVKVTCTNSSGTPSCGTVTSTDTTTLGTGGCGAPSFVTSAGAVSVSESPSAAVATDVQADVCVNYN